MGNNNLMKKRRALAILLCLAMLTGSTAGMGTAAGTKAVMAASDMEEAGENNTGDASGRGAEKNSTKTYFAMEGINITHEITASWDGGFNADVTITNTGKEKIQNWKISMMPADGVSICGIWNAACREAGEEKESTAYIISNAGWNQDIAAGGGVSFGYRAAVSFSDSGDGKDDGISSYSKYAPKECSLVGGISHAGQKEYKILFRALEGWGDSSIVETSILNISDKDIEDWQLLFSWEGVRIKEAWDADVREKDEGYLIENRGYNSCIPAGKSVVFTMLVESSLKNMEYPEDCSLIHYGEGGAFAEESAKPDATPIATGIPASTATPAATIPAVTEGAVATSSSALEEQEITEEMRCWNRTMLHMDEEEVQEAVGNTKEKIKVAIIDSGVDEMEGIHIESRVNLISGEEEMGELFEDSTGHGTAIAGLMVFRKADGENSMEAEEEAFMEGRLCYFPDNLEEEETDGSGEESETQTNKTEENVEETINEEDGEAETDGEEGEDNDEEADGEEGTFTSFGDFIEENQADFEGINPNMELHSIRVLDENNEAPAGRIAEGIRWARENGIRILNISFGTETDSRELHEEIKKAYKEGMLIIAAVGNDGKTQYPAAYEEVIGIGSVDCTGTVGESSVKDETVELTAPGEGVLTVGPFGVETQAYGTSMAAGEASALASILWQQNPSASNSFIRSLLAAGANKCDSSSGHGMIDIARSLEIYDEFLAAYEEEAGVDFGEDGKEETPPVPEKAEEAITENVEDLMEDAGIEENEEDAQTVEAVVKACWGGKGHLKLIQEDKTNITDNYLLALKNGMRLQDSAKCNLNDKWGFPTWHGCYQYDPSRIKNKDYKKYIKKLPKEEQEVQDANYVAGYLYLTALAKQMSQDTETESEQYELPDKLKWRDVTFKYLIVDGKVVKNNCCMEGVITKTGINSQRFDGGLTWNKVYTLQLHNPEISAKDTSDNVVSGPSLATQASTQSALITKKKEVKKRKQNIRALTVFGMGLHTMSDTFAHSCQAAEVSTGGSICRWKNIGKLRAREGYPDTKGEYNDSPKVINQRYKAAKQAVRNAMDHIGIVVNEETGKERLKIKTTKAGDFASRKACLKLRGENDAAKKADDIINIKDYCFNTQKYKLKLGGKVPEAPAYMDLAYLEAGFGVRKIRDYVEACGKCPGYFGRIDLGTIKKVTMDMVAVIADASSQILPEGTTVKFSLKKKEGKKEKTLFKSKKSTFRGMTERLAVGIHEKIWERWMNKKANVWVQADYGQGGNKKLYLMRDGEAVERVAFIDLGTEGMMRIIKMKQVAKSGKWFGMSVYQSDGTESGTTKHPIDSYRMMITNRVTGRVVDSATYRSANSFFLPEGFYTLKIEKEGFQPFIQDIYSDGDNNSGEHLEDAVLMPEGGSGSVSGIVREGLLDKTVEGITVYARKGWNRLTFEPVACAVTDSEGRYCLENLPAGNYCLNFVDGTGNYEQNWRNITIWKDGMQEEDCRVIRTDGERKMEIRVSWNIPDDRVYYAYKPLPYIARRTKNSVYYFTWEDSGYYGENANAIEVEWDDGRPFVMEAGPGSGSIYIGDILRDGFALRFLCIQGALSREKMKEIDMQVEIYYNGEQIASCKPGEEEDCFWDNFTYDRKRMEFLPGFVENKIN